MYTRYISEAQLFWIGHILICMIYILTTNDLSLFIPFSTLGGCGNECGCKDGCCDEKVLQEKQIEYLKDRKSTCNFGGTPNKGQCRLARRH